MIPGTSGSAPATNQSSCCRSSPGAPRKRDQHEDGREQAQPSRHHGDERDHGLGVASDGTARGLTMSTYGAARRVERSSAAAW